MSYDPAATAILLVDPYNEFIGEAGKLWPRVQAIAEEVHLLDHLRQVVSTARADNPSPYQLGAAKAQVFAKDTWGGTFHDDFQPQEGDIVALEHWGSSGFANTDLDLNSTSTAYGASS